MVTAPASVLAGVTGALVGVHVAQCPFVARLAMADKARNLVLATSSVLARCRGTLVDVFFAAFALVPGWAVAA